MKCLVDGCERSAYCRGYCQRHYQQLRLSGKLERKTFANKGLTCKVDGCKRAAKIQGMCKKHYYTLTRYPIKKKGSKKSKVYNVRSVESKISSLQQQLHQARMSYCNSVGAATQLRWKRLIVALEEEIREHKALLTDKTKSLNSKVAN